MKHHVSNDSTSLESACTSKGTSDPNGAAKLQLKMGFRHRQSIGELMLAVVTCRPDALFPKMILSKHNTCPDEFHYAVVKRENRCIRSTINYGLNFWRPAADSALPTTAIPALHKDTHNSKTPDSYEL